MGKTVYVEAYCKYLSLVAVAENVQDNGMKHWGGVQANFHQHLEQAGSLLSSLRRGFKAHGAKFSDT